MDKKLFDKAKHNDKNLLKFPFKKEEMKKFSEQDDKGKTLVHYLAINKNKDVLRLPKELLEIQDKTGCTPLHYLGMLGIVDILERKDSLSIQDKYGNNPLSYLAQVIKTRNDANKLLKASGKVLMQKNNNRKNVFHYLSDNKNKDVRDSILNSNEKILAIQDSLGRTPIHNLAIHEDEEIIKLPIKLLMIKDSYGNTPIHYLAKGNTSGDFLDLPNEILYEENNEGETPYSLANERAFNDEDDYEQKDDDDDEENEDEKTKADNFNIKDLVKEGIKKYGNKANLNYIDTSDVTSMRKLFADMNFNGDISEWDVSNVKDMRLMFFRSNFNKDISKWKVNDKVIIDNMFERCPLSKNPPKWYTNKINSKE